MHKLRRKANQTNGVVSINMFIPFLKYVANYSVGFTWAGKGKGQKRKRNGKGDGKERGTTGKEKGEERERKEKRKRKPKGNKIEREKHGKAKTLRTDTQIAKIMKQRPIRNNINMFAPSFAFVANYSVGSIWPKSKGQKREREETKCQKHIKK